MAGNIKGITIQLGADTTKLSKALSSADKAIKNTQKQLSDVQNALKFDPGNTDLLADKQRLLGDRVNETKQKLDALQAAQEALDAQGVDKNSEEYKKLQTQIDVTKSKLSGLEEEQDKFGSVGSQKIAVMGDKVKEVGDKVGKVGSSLTKAVTAPIIAVGAASAAAWNEVDAGMDTIVTKTGATGSALEDMQQRMQNIAATIPTDFQTAGDAVGEVNTRFGLTGDALEDLSAQFIKFAQINNKDVNSSIDSVQQVMSAFNISADQAGNVLDLLNVVGQNTGISMDSLESQLVSNSTALQSLGLNIGDAAGLLGQLDKSGVDASVVFTGLSKVQKTAMEDGVSMQDELQKAVSTSDDAIDIFGSKAGPKLYEAFQNGTLSVYQFAESIEGESGLEDSLGSVNETFEGTLDPADQMTVAMNNLKETGAELFTTVQEMAVPILKEAVEKMQNLHIWFQQLTPDQQQMIVKVAAAAAAIGPLLVVIGKVIHTVGTIMTMAPKLQLAFTSLTGPIGIAVAAIGGAIAVGVLLYKNWDKIKSKATELGNTIKEKWNGIKSNTSEAWSNVKESVSQKWNDMKSKIANSAIGQTVGQVWDAAKQTTTDRLASIKAAYDVHGGGMTGAVAATGEVIKQHFSSGFGFIDTLTNGKFSSMTSTVQGKMSDIGSSVSGKLEEVKGFFTSKLGSAASATDLLLGNIASAATTKMQNMKDTIRGALDNITGFFGGLHWELPKIKLPHFSISGSFSLDPPSVPHLGVDWYDKGGIFSSPTVIGVGEKRPEFVGALDDLRSIVREEAGGGSRTDVLLAQTVTLLTQLVKQGAGIKVTQNIYANETSYSEQQKQASRNFKEIARELI